MAELVIDNHVLLIAFKFPPLGGVGVRRWTKFAKYLARNGYFVDIVTVKHSSEAANTWLSDLDDPRITVHRIPSNFPHNLYLRKYGRGFSDKVKNRLKVRGFGLLRYLFWLDEAQYWGRSLIPYCERLIKEHNIVNVTATGAPFSVNYQAARLKHRLPSINLINDWRDPWNDNPLLDHPGFFRFKWQKSRSEKMEAFALANSDFVTGVSDGLIDLLKKRTTNPSTKFRTISNGFDPDYFAGLVRRPDSDKFVLCYTGNLFSGREAPFSRLLEAILELTETHDDFRRQFVLKTYGGFPYGISVDYSLLVRNGNLEINSHASPDIALQAAKDAFLLLLVNADIFPYLVSAKVYEYIALRRPVLAVSSPGGLTRMIDQVGFGDAVSAGDKETIKALLLHWMDVWSGNPAYEPEVAQEVIDGFADPYIVRELISCFKEGPL